MTERKEYEKVVQEGLAVTFEDATYLIKYVNEELVIVKSKLPRFFDSTDSTKTYHMAIPEEILTLLTKALEYGKASDQKQRSTNALINKGWGLEHAFDKITKKDTASEVSNEF